MSGNHSEAACLIVVTETGRHTQARINVDMGFSIAPISTQHPQPKFVKIFAEKLKIWLNQCPFGEHE
jgi:hypothetical protein